MHIASDSEVPAGRAKSRVIEIDVLRQDSATTWAPAVNARLS